MARPSKKSENTAQSPKKVIETPLAKQYNQIKARYPGHCSCLGWAIFTKPSEKMP
jgi:hypothetical protein